MVPHMAVLISIQVLCRVAVLGCSGFTVAVCGAWVSAMLMVLLRMPVAELLALQSCGVACCCCLQTILCYGPVA